MDGSSTRSDDLQTLGYRLDWNDPLWESAEPPCLRFSSLAEADEEEEEEEEERGQVGTAEVPGVAASNGSVYMPVGFINQNQEYFPFMELPAEPTDMFLEPAILQKVTVNQTMVEPGGYTSANGQSERMLQEPQTQEPDHAWSPAASHADWEGLGEKRGVQQFNSGNSWSSSYSHGDWKARNRSTRQQRYEKSFASPCNSWDNQVRQWDEPWGM